MPELIAHGSVWLVGAGPGDPDLLTRKAQKLICAADVIFYDALIGPGVLALIPPHIECISVGKRSGRHSKDQQSINDLIVEAALAGKRVVRLKGGDPSIFGRSTEEMEALATHGILCKVCPGVTAASAAAASAGISLTKRGLARKLSFITAHAKTDEPLNLDWASLADPNATLAIYMGKASAQMIQTSLIAHGLPGDTPALIVENASLADERCIETSLVRLAATIQLTAGDGPMILILGQAVKRGCTSDLAFDEQLQSHVA